MKSFGRLSLAALALGLLASMASADVQEYCGAYARDVANGRVSGGEILNGKVAGTTPETSVKWIAVNGAAMAGCLAQYVNGAGGPTETVTAAAAPRRVLSKPRPAAKKIAKSRRRTPSLKPATKTKARVPRSQAGQNDCILVDSKTSWYRSRKRLKFCNLPRR